MQRRHVISIITIYEEHADEEGRPQANSILVRDYNNYGYVCAFHHVCSSAASTPFLCVLVWQFVDWGALAMAFFPLPCIACPCYALVWHGGEMEDACVSTWRFLSCNDGSVALSACSAA